MEQNYYKKNKGKYSYLLLVIFSLFFLTLAICLINFTHDDPESKKVLPFLLIIGGFSLFIFIVSSIAQIQLLVKSKNEEKVLETGFSSKGRISKIILSETATAKYGVKNYHEHSLYCIIISYNDKNGAERQYKPSLKFNRTDISYLLYKGEFAVICNEKCCAITEQMDNAYIADNDLMENFIKTQKDDPKLKGIKRPKGLSYKAILIISPLVLIFILISSILGFGNVFYNSIINGSMQEKIITIFIIVAIVFTLSKAYFSTLTAYLTSKKGKQDFATYFKITSYNPRGIAGMRVTITFTYKDKNGNEKRTKQLLQYNQYEIVKSLDKLPILVYKGNAVVDYDRFPKI